MALVEPSSLGSFGLVQHNSEVGRDKAVVCLVAPQRQRSGNWSRNSEIGMDKAVSVWSFLGGSWPRFLIGMVPFLRRRIRRTRQWSVGGHARFRSRLYGFGRLVLPLAEGAGRVARGPGPFENDPAPILVKSFIAQYTTRYGSPPAPFLLLGVSFLLQSGAQAEGSGGSQEKQ